MSWSKDDAGASSPIDEDLAAVYQGGENFLARAQMLSDLRAKHDQALKDLNLGLDVHRAIETAKKAAAEALEKSQKADQALADAKQRAAEIIAEAEKQAADIVAQAESTAGAIVGDAQNKKGEVEAYVKEETAKVNEALRFANDKVISAEQARRTAEAEQARAELAAKEAFDARVKYESMHDKFLKKLERLDSVIKEVASGAD